MKTAREYAFEIWGDEEVERVIAAAIAAARAEERERCADEVAACAMDWEWLAGKQVEAHVDSAESEAFSRVLKKTESRLRALPAPDGDVRPDWVPWPADRAPRYLTGTRCDMLVGPCACGATHPRESATDGDGGGA